jgi:thiol-disulfide isomerase/thioredoxin
MTKHFAIFALLLLILAACAPDAAQTSIQSPTATVVEAAATVVEATATPTSEITPTESAAVDGAAASAITRPAWQTLPLVNARTGETFTFADFAGKTVFVEPMATWCTNCRQQLGNVNSARAQVSADQVVFVALSVETNITAADLAQYADQNGFDWVFAVMTPEVLGELTNAFGRTITNPPSTPHFIIRPNGSTTDLVTGIESSDQIVQQIQSASAG